MDTKTFRKRPVEVQAYQWQEHGDDYEQDRPGEIVPLTHHDETIFPERSCEKCDWPAKAHGWIPTLEGGHQVCPEDWIITGVEGERYPCKPSVFEATYEEVAQRPEEAGGMQTPAHELGLPTALHNALTFAYERAVDGRSPTRMKGEAQFTPKHFNPFYEKQRDKLLTVADLASDFEKHPDLFRSMRQIGEKRIASLKKAIRKARLYVEEGQCWSWRINQGAIVERFARGSRLGLPEHAAFATLIDWKKPGVEDVVRFPKSKLADYLDISFERAIDLLQSLEEEGLITPIFNTE